MTNGLPKDFKIRFGREMSAIDGLFESAGSTLRKHGYTKILPSALMQASEDFVSVGNRIKLIDYNGDVLSVIGEGVAALLSACEVGKPQRLFFAGETYSLFSERPYGRNKIELAFVLSGVQGVEAEAEMVGTVFDLLQKWERPVAKIVINNTSVLTGMINFYLNGKTSVDKVKGLLNGELNTDIDFSCEKLIRETASVKGGLSAIKEAAERITNKESVDALVSLFEWSQLLAEYRLDDCLEFDMSYMGVNAYDNGNVFKCMDEQGNVLAAGSRHDIMKNNGVLRAVSVRLFPDALMNDMPNSKKCSDVLLGVAPGVHALSKAYRIKQSLLANNLSVETLYQVDTETCQRVREEQNNESLIYIDKNGDVTHI